MKIKGFYTVLPILLLVFSCNKDDNAVEEVPVRDKAEVYAEDIAEIEVYLKTHFYNYEDFDLNDPYKEENDAVAIKFDTIAGTNANKTPLIDQVLSKTVTDSEGFKYKLYFLNVREGKGDTPNFTDRVHVVYSGSLLNGVVFDSSANTIPFDLITNGTSGGVISGFKEGILEFKTSTSFETNTDGTVSYSGFGKGAVFIPSGLGYFSATQANIPAYSPLIFTINLMQHNLRDHDNDGVFSHLEDLNGDKNAFNDDTDLDRKPNYLDDDDDGDGVPTIQEDLDCDKNPANDDSNNDGTPNYLDKLVFTLARCS